MDKILIDYIKNCYWQSASESDHLLIYNKYPEYQYEGRAYRVVFLDQGQSLNTHQISDPFRSWTKQLKGIANFMTYSITESVESEYIEQALVYSGKVKGIDLSSIVNDLIKDNCMEEEVFANLSEEEIIPLYPVTEIEEVKSDFVKTDLKKQLMVFISNNFIPEDFETQEEDLSKYLIKIKEFNKKIKALKAITSPMINEISSESDSLVHLLDDSMSKLRSYQQADRDEEIRSKEQTLIHHIKNSIIHSKERFLLIVSEDQN